MPCLGHLVARDGSCAACWKDAFANAQRAFWKQAAHTLWRTISPVSRLKIIDRVCWPILAARAGRWCLTAGCLQQADSLQRKLIIWSRRYQKTPGEPWDAFMRRKGREARREAEERGRWSTKLCLQVVQWKGHLDRHRDCWAWRLEQLMTKQSLMERRASRQGGLLAGRTGTRAKACHVHKRWHAGVQVAEEHLAMARVEGLC